ncbi:MAG: HNH endonuclease [Kiritimatiellae bacterium]|nr:HNH endonuclease [Kiritimatiellia bacterium]
MSLPLDFIPKRPFPEFKWKWASLQCTEGLNDPVVLLGVLFRMRKLELTGKKVKYSSDAFAEELKALAEDIKGRGISVDIARRTGERNLIRNSGQYWRAIGLLPTNESGGVITLTPFGRLVADRKISQTEFAAITIQTFTLPNPAIQPESECKQWLGAGLKLKPLLMLLSILEKLDAVDGEGYLTKRELLDIIVPLSGVKESTAEDCVVFVKAFRQGKLDISRWPNCYESANDHRIAREFLLFLANYGYVNIQPYEHEERFWYNREIDEQIQKLLDLSSSGSYNELISRLKEADIVPEIERKRVAKARNRPNQPRFRREVLGKSPRCVITNVTMPEVLEAAHIIPFKYKGEDTRANGLAMRLDIHQLFDTGHLRIHADGTVFLTDRARMDYGALIPPVVHLPDYINRDFVRWRWDNYNGV